MTQLADDLRAARKLIEKPENWGKGRYESAGRYCADGARRWSAANRNLSNESTRAMGRALEAALPKPFSAVTRFNDHPDTTHADVLALFDAAIEQAEAQQ